MNPVADFFRRHHAVSATDSGPTWSRADEATLLAWFNRLAPVVRCGWNAEQGRDATDDERRGSAKLYEAVAAEITKRATSPDPSPEIMGAAVRASLPIAK